MDVENEDDSDFARGALFARTFLADRIRERWSLRLERLRPASGPGDLILRSDRRAARHPQALGGGAGLPRVRGGIPHHGPGRAALGAGGLSARPRVLLAPFPRMRRGGRSRRQGSRPAPARLGSRCHARAAWNTPSASPSSSAGSSTPRRCRTSTRKLANLLCLAILHVLDHRRARPSDDDDRVPMTAREARRILSRGFQGDISTSVIARELDCNPDYLGRIYKRSYGSSIMDDLHELRIKLAKRLTVGREPERERGGQGVRVLGRRLLPAHLQAERRPRAARFPQDVLAHAHQHELTAFPRIRLPQNPSAIPQVVFKVVSYVRYATFNNGVARMSREFILRYSRSDCWHRRERRQYGVT